MAELINKWKVVDMLTALENEFQHYKPFHGFEHAMYRKVVEVEMEIGKMAAVEVEPVAHARWEFEYIQQIAPNCSNCGMQSIMAYPNCPYCRAKMKNGRNPNE